MEERRGVPRWLINTSLLYQVLGKDSDFSSGLLEDINLLGAKANLKTEVLVRSRLKLVIEIPYQAAPIFTEGEVIWQNAQGAKFPTGIRFTRFKSADKEHLMNYFDREIRQSWWREESA